MTGAPVDTQKSAVCTSYRPDRHASPNNVFLQHEIETATKETKNTARYSSLNAAA